MANLEPDGYASVETACQDPQRNDSRFPGRACTLVPPYHPRMAVARLCARHAGGNASAKRRSGQLGSQGVAACRLVGAH